MKKNPPVKKHFFETLAAKVSLATGSTAAIITAFGSVVLWAALGPVFHYSENWQLVINTGTTIITFLMVFLIQKSQNKESIAVQLKLNELVAAQEYASNRLVDVEDMTEEELRALKKYYGKLKEKAKTEESLQKAHSVEETGEIHELKKDIKRSVEKNVKQSKKK
ncbi:MAG: low affinity iron permease family protein [Ginsengibacter sp.]